MLKDMRIGRRLGLGLGAVIVLLALEIAQEHADGLTALSKVVAAQVGDINLALMALVAVALVVASLIGMAITRSITASIDDAAVSSGALPAIVGRALLAASLAVVPSAGAEDTPAAPALQWHLFASASVFANRDGGVDPANQFRTFDQDTGLRLDLASLSVEYKPGPFGFRVDLAAGHSVPVFAPAGAWQPETLDAKQAWLSWTPGPGRPEFRLGRFVTLAGYELIEDWDATNDNLSRSFLFGYAIPFTHTGLRVLVPAGEKASLVAGVNRGWDRFTDEDHAPSYELAATLRPSGKTNLAVALLAGPETVDVRTRWRFLLDASASVRPSERWLFAVNADWGAEDRLEPGGTAPAWGGVAVYGVWSPSSRTSVALRLEEFRDPQGVRTGRPQTLRDADLTLGWRWISQLRLRLDLRFDRSSTPVFGTAAEGLGTTQATLGVGVSYSFKGR